MATKLLLTCLTAIAVSLSPASAHADRTKLVVVVAKGSELTNISRSDLKNCFLGSHVISGDKPLVPFNAAASSPERTAFDRAILGMTPDETGRFWVDRTVRGQSAAPRSLPSATHLAKVAAKFPNAIAYVPSDRLTPDVQAVKVDGLAYTDNRYPITVP